MSTKRKLPEVTQEKDVTINPTEIQDELPEDNKLEKNIPDPKELTKELPPEVNPDNVVWLRNSDGTESEYIEIKPTKVKYQRNRTAAAYHILEIYPLPDVLAMDAGTLDPDRDGDAVVFDFLTAVFDNNKLVRKYYNEMTTEDIERIIKIFKRLNKIEDKEEAAKNRAAKGTSR